MCKRILNMIIVVLAIPIIIIGSIGFFRGLLVSFDTQSKNYNLPLGEARGIVVDSSGRVYVGAHFYTKVLVYSNKGKYEGCLNFDAGGGDFRIIIDKDDIVSISTVRNKMVYKFNKDRVLISAEANSNAYQAFGTENEYQFRDKQSNIYRISSQLSFPTILKQTPNGDETNLVSTSLYQWIFLGPFPAGLFVIVGIAAILISTGLLKKILI